MAQRRFGREEVLKVFRELSFGIKKYQYLKGSLHDVQMKYNVGMGSITKGHHTGILDDIGFEVSDQLIADLMLDKRRRNVKNHGVKIKAFYLWYTKGNASSWIAGRYYDPDLRIFGIIFKPVETNGKPPVILFNAGKEIVIAMDNAPSKGRFYLEHIALGHRKLKKKEGFDFNPNSKVMPIDIIEWCALSKDITMGPITLKYPERIVASVVGPIEMHMNSMSNEKGIMQEYIEARKKKFATQGKLDIFNIKSETEKFRLSFDHFSKNDKHMSGNELTSTKEVRQWVRDFDKTLSSNIRNEAKKINANINYPKK